MSKARSLADLISGGATIEASEIADSTITGGKLASDIVITTSGNISTTGDLTVDTNTLYVDATNNRVGIGTTSPEVGLDFQMINSGEGFRVRRHNASSQYIEISETDGSRHEIKAIGDKELRIFNEASSNSTTFYTNSTERMRINQSGNVGIGTSSPTSPLMVQSNEITPIHVKGANTKAILLETTGGETSISTLQLKNSAYTWNVEGGRRANTLTFYAGTVGGERMCIDGSSGNVGIGTSSPDSKLTVNGDVTLLGGDGGVLIFDNRDAIVTDGEDIGTINFTVSGDSNITGTRTMARMEVLADGAVTVDTTARGKINFKTSTGNDNLLDRMLIRYNGDISFYEDTGTTAKFFWDASAESLGIGTSSPAPAVGTDKVLEIAGSGSPGLVINDTGQAQKYQLYADSTKFKMSYGSTGFFTYDASNGNLGIGTATPTDTNGFGKALDIQGSSGAAIYVGSSGDRGIFGYASGEQHIVNPSASGTTRFTINGSERMRISNTGDVGIGTTSPTAKLNVNGAIVGGHVSNSSPDNVDVSGANSLSVSTGAGNRTINGLVGGVQGQVLHIIKTNTASTLTIANQNATAPGDDIYTANGSNISLTNLGGVTLLYYNGAWYEVGK